MSNDSNVRVAVRIRPLNSREPDDRAIFSARDGTVVRGEHGEEGWAEACWYTAAALRGKRCCPIFGCGAALKRCADLVRDCELRSQIEALPADAQTAWRSADGTLVLKAGVRQ